MRAVLMTICLAALVAACDSEPPIRISRDSGSESSNTDGPLRVVDTLQCPQTHEVLTRRGGPSADGRSCEYTGPRGSQVTLRLVTLDGEGLAALDALEAEVQAILPAAMERVGGANATAAPDAGTNASASASTGNGDSVASNRRARPDASNVSTKPRGRPRCRSGHATNSGADVAAASESMFTESGVPTTRSAQASMPR